MMDVAAHSEEEFEQRPYPRERADANRPERNKPHHLFKARRH